MANCELAMYNYINRNFKFLINSKDISSPKKRGKKSANGDITLNINVHTYAKYLLTI